MKAMQRLDPEGVAKRSKGQLHRRKYFSKVISWTLIIDMKI